MKQLLSLLVALFLSVGLAFGAVNVNTATQAELETLNGIGPAKAKAIIDHRTKHGPFKSFEDLDKVPGIGEGTIGKIKSEVTFSGKTTVTAADTGKSKESRSKASTDKTAKTEKSDAKAVKSGKDEKSEKRKSTEEKSVKAATKDSKAEAKETKSDAKKKSATDSKKAGSEASTESKDAKGKSSKKDETAK